MPTTIAVRPETLEMLHHMKVDLEAESYDEVIRKLVVNMKRPQKSLFGKLKTRQVFVREKIDRFG